MRRILLILLTLALGGSLYAGWRWYGSLPLGVAAVQPTRGPAVEAVYATGTVEPINWAKIAPTLRARIESFAVKEGDRVQRGDVLVRLDDRKEQASLSELQAREKWQRDEFQRLDTLLERNVATKAARDKSLMDLEQTRALIENMRHRIGDLTLRAPLDGTVLRKDGEIGETVKEGEVLMTVGERAPLRISAEVDEEDIPRVRLGQPALIKADAFVNRVFDGTVSEVTPLGDPVNKSYRVRIALPADTALLIGMTTEVNIVVRREAQALLVPAAALYRTGTPQPVGRRTSAQAARLWTVVDGRAKAQTVTVGVRGDELVEIREGLAEDATVVLNPPPDIAEGQRLRVKDGRAWWHEPYR